MSKHGRFTDRQEQKHQDRYHAKEAGKSKRRREMLNAYAEAVFKKPVEKKEDEK
jgi:hypothetical protein